MVGLGMPTAPGGSDPSYSYPGEVPWPSPRPGRGRDRRNLAPRQSVRPSVRLPPGVAAIRWKYTYLLLRRVWKILLAYSAIVIVASSGFYLLENGSISPLNSVYWAIVTLSTVGYGDVVPTTFWAKVFTIAVIGGDVFLVAYLVSVVIGVVGEEAQHRQLGTFGTELRDHVVVIGYGGVGQAAVRELLAQGEKVAVLTQNVESIPNIRVLAPESRLFATYESEATPEVLERLNVRGALAVIVCTADDSLNLVAAISVRALNPDLRVVVSITRPELRQTLKAAGVTYVTSPGDLGGRLCASASFRPEIPNVIEDLTTTVRGFDITEYILSESTPIARQSLSEAEQLVRKQSGCLVLGYARPNAANQFKTVLNPPLEFQFQPGDAIIVMGTLENLHRFQRWFGVPQGR